MIKTKSVLDEQIFFAVQKQNTSLAWCAYLYLLGINFVCERFHFRVLQPLCSEAQNEKINQDCLLIRCRYVLATGADQRRAPVNALNHQRYSVSVSYKNAEYITIVYSHYYRHKHSVYSTPRKKLLNLSTTSFNGT